MAIYKNDYSKDEDFALWNLHEIRKKLALRGLSSGAINKSARDILRKHGLSRIKSQGSI